MTIRLILISTNGIHRRLKSHLSLSCKEDSLHSKCLDKFDNKDNYNNDEDKDRDKGSTRMVDLRIPLTSKVPDFWKEIQRFYHVVTL